MGHILFFLLSIVCVGAVSAMILSRNPAHNALFLVLAFAALGGLFGMLDAPFVAAIQILVYAGAIMVLFIFVVMMVKRQPENAAAGGRRTKKLAFLLAAVLGFELIWAVKDIFSQSGPGKAVATGTADLGRLLIREYLYPFEITSILIVAALVGALALTGKRGRP